MADIEDEFEKLLAKRRAQNGGANRGPVRKVSDRTGGKSGVLVPDEKHPDRGPAQRTPVPAGPKARATGKNRPQPATSGPAASKGPLRESRGSTEPEWGNRVPFEPLVIPPEKYPKKFTPGQLKRGDSVWYRGERYYIESFPTDWSAATYARISSLVVRDNLSPAEFEHAKAQAGAMSMCVPVDTLEMAPVARNPYAKQPTKTAIERREERKRTGATDIGDEVAVMLRECASLDDVYRVAADYVGMTEKELRGKYGHLNPGQQRMNLGNKMRNFMKRMRP